MPLARPPAARVAWLVGMESLRAARPGEASAGT